MKLLKYGKIIVVGLLVTICQQTVAFIDPTLEPHLRPLGVTPVQVSLLFLLCTLFVAIFSPITGAYSGRKENKFHILGVGQLIFCLAFLFLGPSFIMHLSPNVLWSALGMGIMGLGYAFAFIPTFESMLKLAM